MFTKAILEIYDIDVEDIITTSSTDPEMDGTLGEDEGGAAIRP